MCLGGQGNQRGYAMAALLVSLGVMTVLMSVAMPVWRHQAQREKEAELIFRGEQYARAINLYQRKMGPGNFPPSIDVLVQQRFLRKKYKDPMTEDGEFEIIRPAARAAGQIRNAAARPGRTGGPVRRRRGPTVRPQPRGDSSGPPANSAARSAAVDRRRHGRSQQEQGNLDPHLQGFGTHYNEWASSSRT